MRFDDAVRLLEGIPYTSPAKGRVFHDLALQRRPRQVLELGFAHGVSAGYFTGAAQEVVHCRITAVDLEQSHTFTPCIEELLERFGARDLVSVHREVSSYTWFLKKDIQRQTRAHVCIPKYDLIFIDGPKDWTNDGCVFFLADKLLRPNGTLLCDDCNWSYRGDELARGTKHSRGYIFEKMSEDEFREPHVRAVFQCSDAA